MCGDARESSNKNTLGIYNFQAGLIFYVARSRVGWVKLPSCLCAVIKSLIRKLDWNQMSHLSLVNQNNWLIYKHFVDIEFVWRS